MKKRGKHASLTSIIAGILAAGIVLSCAGCSSGQGTTDSIPFVESAPITMQPVESTEVPVEIVEVSFEPVEPSSMIETAAPSDPVEPPSAEPPAAAEPSETAGGENADMPQASKGLASLDVIDDSTMVYTGTHTVYNFKTSGYAGCGLDGTVKPFEMYYGVYAEADGTKITYHAYSHLEDVTPVSARIKRPSTNRYVDLPIAFTDNTFDMYKQANDAFVLTVKFSNDKACTIDLYANDGEPWVVNTSTYDVEKTKSLILDRYDGLTAILEESDVTPESSIGVTTKDIAYPTYAGHTNHRCDTELWKVLAHEIVTDDDLGDTVKLTMLHDWMTANMSYDYYKVHKLGTSRSNYHKDWSGTWNVYDTRTGKCSDFVNVLAIMSRELGIPCNSVETETHTWNVVYVDGTWYEIDMTTDINRYVYGEDVTSVTNPDRTVAYGAFMSAKTRNDISEVKSAGEAIFTEAFARGGK